jgi:hypothetical protein
MPENAFIVFLIMNAGPIDIPGETPIPRIAVKSVFKQNMYYAPGKALRWYPGKGNLTMDKPVVNSDQLYHIILSMN